MGCDCKGQLIVLANNSRIESERNGGPAIYWDDPSNAMKFLGATSVQVWVDVIQAYPSTGASLAVSLVAQQSVDGVDWDIDSVTTITSWTAVGKASQRVLVESRADFGPYVRLGVQIRNSATTLEVEEVGQVAARLSLAVLPYDGDNEVASGGGTLNHNMTSAGEVAGTEIFVGSYKSIVIGVVYTGVTGSPNLKVQTSANGTVWYDTDAALSGTTQGLLIPTRLMAYIQLVVDTAGGAGTLDSWSYVGRAF